MHAVCRYRDGSAEVRRSRRLVISFISTVVNYECAPAQGLGLGVKRSG